MASRVIFLFVAVLLTANSCQGNRRDDLIDDYYNRLLFQKSGHISKKQAIPDLPVPYNRDPIVTKEALVSPTPLDLLTTEKSKRTSEDFSAAYAPDLNQEIFGSLGGVTQNGVWPCYCKYLI